jgi:hypothetical protein
MIAKLCAVLLVVALIAAIVLGFNFIPWLIWNKVVAPMFDWRQVGFVEAHFSKAFGAVPL